MNLTGNTILITGGGTGIGRALAEALHQAGNRVIVAGRRQSVLQNVATSNPGIEFASLDVQNPRDLASFASEILLEYPDLNVLINNAGIMKSEDLNDPDSDFAIVEATIQTNLLAPLRLTSSLLPHLKKQPSPVVMTVSSGLAFTPLAMTPTYCATKAAIHSWTQSLRFQLQGSPVQVIELIPPYVQTELMGPQQTHDPRAMPLADFTSEVMQILRTHPNSTEICVQRVFPLRFAAEQGQSKYEEVFQGLNNSMRAAAERRGTPPARR